MYIIPPIRGNDKWGSGAFHAPRTKDDGTKYLHRGVDIACYKGSKIPAIVGGEFEKIGYPYPYSDKKPEKNKYRYVQIIDAQGLKWRYFYVEPKKSLERNTIVEQGEIIGETQGLIELYPGIIDHCHTEIETPTGDFIDPTLHLNRISIVKYTSEILSIEKDLKELYKRLQGITIKRLGLG